MVAFCEWKTLLLSLYLVSHQLSQIPVAVHFCFISPFLIFDEIFGTVIYYIFTTVSGFPRTT